MIAELTIATVCTYILCGIISITLSAIGLLVAISVLSLLGTTTSGDDDG